MEVKYPLYGIVALIVLQLAFVFWNSQRNGEVVDEFEIIPTDFSFVVNNKYFTLVPGKKMNYEAKKEGGIEKIEVFVTHETKSVMGVETIVVWDRVWFNGELIEDTKDWYAQDKEGNVWYFGEDSVELVAGKIVGRTGSWEAGVDGAKPGVIMKANPKISESYQQEYYRGVAEDKADVLALKENVNVMFGDFSNCLKTLDYTPLEPSAKEHKYYCPAIGGVALEIDLDGGERVELVSLEYNTASSADVEERVNLEKKITESEAKDIALTAVPGRVTDFAIEKKFGKIVYVVEIAADKGSETDVFIDINTGKILGVEN